MVTAIQLCSWSQKENLLIPSVLEGGFYECSRGTYCPPLLLCEVLSKTSTRKFCYDHENFVAWLCCETNHSLLSFFFLSFFKCFACRYFLLCCRILYCPCFPAHQLSISWILFVYLLTIKYKSNLNYQLWSRLIFPHMLWYANDGKQESELLFGHLSLQFYQHYRISDCKYSTCQTVIIFSRSRSWCRAGSFSHNAVCRNTFIKSFVELSTY